jgi:predicted transcriptional regulator
MSEMPPEEEDREREVNRSAETGQFVTEEEAEENPDTTVHETFDE